MILRVQDILKSPINAISYSLDVSNGNIHLNHFDVLSEAFTAHTEGIIPLQDPFKSSPVDLPVDLSLRKSIAIKANLLSLNSPNESRYIRIPQFATLVGNFEKIEITCRTLRVVNFLAMKLE